MRAYFAAVLLLASAPAFGQAVSPAIKLDHFGYRPGDARSRSSPPTPARRCRCATPANAVVFTVPTDGGAITAKGPDGPGSGDTVWWVDFSPFATPGAYRLYSPTLGAQSYDFDDRAATSTATVVRAALKTLLPPALQHAEARRPRGRLGGCRRLPHGRRRDDGRGRPHRPWHARPHRRLARRRRLQQVRVERHRGRSSSCCAPTRATRRPSATTSASPSPATACPTSSTR